MTVSLPDENHAFVENRPSDGNRLVSWADKDNELIKWLDRRLKAHVYPELYYFAVNPKWALVVALGLNFVQNF